MFDSNTCAEVRGILVDLSEISHDIQHQRFKSNVDNVVKQARYQLKYNLKLTPFDRKVLERIASTVTYGGYLLFEACQDYNCPVGGLNEKLVPFIDNFNESAEVCFGESKATLNVLTLSELPYLLQYADELIKFYIRVGPNSDRQLIKGVLERVTTYLRSK